MNATARTTISSIRLLWFEVLPLAISCKLGVPLDVEVAVEDADAVDVIDGTAINVESLVSPNAPFPKRGNVSAERGGRRGYVDIRLTGIALRCSMPNERCRYQYNTPSTHRHRR